MTVVVGVPTGLVPPLLRTGSNIVHGTVLVGAMVAPAAADTTQLRIIGVIGVILAARNAVGTIASRGAAARAAPAGVEPAAAAPAAAA